MKRGLIGLVAGLVFAGAGLYAFREPVKQAVMDRMTANMFVARDSDSYDPGIAMGEPFPPIRARFGNRVVSDMGSFVGKRGMVVYVNRSVDW